TRSKRDWSSDVCSSDLDGAGEGDGLGGGERHLTAGIGFDEYVCHGRITPISSRTSTRAGAASGPSPRMVTELCSTSGSSRRMRGLPVPGSGASYSTIGAFFAFIRPVIEG